MIFVLGGHGFVGSAFTRLFKDLGLDYQVITSQNFHEFDGELCDVLINANGNSNKVLAKELPLQDFDASLRSVAQSLDSIFSNNYIYLSSGDVYQSPVAADTARENSEIDVTSISRYGLHKFLAEQMVQATHPDWLIFRMGGFVGPNLTKNAIFDIINGKTVWLDPASELQFIGTDKTAEIIWSVFNQGVRNEVINTGGRGVVKLEDIHRKTKSKSVYKPNAPKIYYELNLDKLESLLGKPISNSITEVNQFLESLDLVEAIDAIS